MLTRPLATSVGIAANLNMLFAAEGQFDINPTMKLVCECVYGLRDGVQGVATAIVVDQSIGVSASQEIGAGLRINAGEIAENPNL
jgi:hypothetical protein